MYGAIRERCRRVIHFQFFFVILYCIENKPYLQLLIQTAQQL